jgi:hypothetical protein
MRRVFRFILLLTPALAQAQPSPNSGWTQIPSSKICHTGIAACSAFCQETVTAPYGWGSAVCGKSGMPGILYWSGGVYDSTRHRLVVWGGGHQDYGGNEIYALSLETLTLSRLNDPCPNPPDPTTGTCSESVCGGTQSPAIHTYDSIEYVPGIDAMFVGPGGSLACSLGNVQNKTWVYRFATNTWEDKNPSRPSSLRTDPGSLSAYESATGLVWFHDNWNLFSYSVASNAYTKRTENPTMIGYHMNGFLDSRRRRFVVAGANSSLGEAPWIYWYDLTATGTIVRHDVDMSGSGCTALGDYPGIDYDSATDRYVAWRGGDTVYEIDPLTFSCTPRTFAGGPGPLDPNSGVGSPGAHGRWRYAPEYDVFVLNNGANANFYTLRLSGGSTSPPPTPTGVRAR